ncbi:MAG: molybdate ABC transporter permease subunit [Actinomycetota bacterium]|nr:molybdate ABC transporter permease subunit [Actinomycetota bacterium]
MADAAFPLWLSIRVALVSTLFVAAIGIPAGYLLAGKNFKGKEVLDAALTMPLVLPPTVAGYFLIVIFGRFGLLGRYIYAATGFNIMFTWYAAALASFVVAFPLMIRTARAAVESVDLKFVNASRLLGHGELVTALKVVLPLARKSILAGVILSLARGMGEFGATLMLAGNIPGKTQTMPLAIYTAAAGGDWKAAEYMVILFTLLSGVALYAANKLTRKSA